MEHGQEMYSWIDDWKEMGCPAIVSDRTRAVAKGVDIVYLLHGAGGTGHIVFDDDNYDDKSIDYSLSITEYGDMPEWEMEFIRDVLRHFKKLTMRERFSAMGLQGGYIKDRNYQRWVERVLPFMDILTREDLERGLTNGAW